MGDSIQVTVEHVPPRTQGGSWLTLTCLDCNNTAGKTVQRQLDRRHEVTFLVGGKLTRGYYKVSANGPVLEVPGERNNPEALRELFGGDGHSVITEFDQRNWQLSRISNLRDAYLWLFAQCGYSLIARREYEWVRQTIRTGERSPYEFGVLVPILKDPNPGIWPLKHPAGAVLVVDGEHACILPSPRCPDPYSQLGADRASITFADQGRHAVALPMPQTTILTWDLSNPTLARPAVFRS